MKLSIIVPVYNEHRTIAIILKRLYGLEITTIQKEIIVVNDGSTDTSEEEVKNFLKTIPSKKNTEVFLLSHEENKGKGAAVRTGLIKASGEYVLIQDADLEYSPTDIRKLLKEVEHNGIRVVYGTRLKRLPNFGRDERTFRFLLHYLGNRSLSLLTSLLYGQWITDMETGYKLIARKALSDISLRAKGFEFEPEVTAKLLKKGNRIVEVPITTNPRGYKEGKKLNTVADGLLALWTLLKYRILD